MANCEICEIIPTIPEELTISEGTYCIANLREHDQTLLGTSFVTLKRHAAELDDLTNQEEEELILVRNSLIRAIRTSFQPITFNISCLKNDAFKSNPSNPSDAAHVHWHIKPRYRPGITTVNDEDFSDPMPGRYLQNFERKTPSIDTAIGIVQIIKSHL